MATRYRLGTTIERIDNAAPQGTAPHDAPYVEVIDLSESGSLGITDPDARHALTALAESHATYVEAYVSCFIGSVALPNRAAPEKPARRFGFYLDARKLVLLDIDGPCREAMDELSRLELAPNPTPARALFELLRHLLKDDLAHLMRLEDKLAHIEDRIIDASRRQPKTPEQILQHRRELMRLTGFYQQFEEMAHDLDEDECASLSHTERHLFGMLSGQAERLAHKAQYLRDYCMQLVELQQAQASRRRDATNLYLTVVASIFVPITTITGWYGMNFSNMPELSWEYGYATVILLCAVIIAAEFIFFKHKRWL